MGRMPAWRHSVGVLYLGADRVDHARQAQEGQVMLQRVRLEIRRKLGPFAAGRAQHAQRFVGHLLVLAQDLGAGFLRHGQYLTILGVRGTAAEHHVGRALCVLDICAVVFVHGAHHFAAAVKRSLAHTGLGRLQRALGQADAGGVIYQRAFGGLALSVAVFAGLASLHKDIARARGFSSPTCSTTVILFCVSVPVLSEQMTCAQPASPQP